MINKQLLQSIISKYFLNGLVESVKWSISNNTLNVKFMSPAQDMLGEVTLKNITLPDAEIAIFDTTKLNKLLAITNQTLNLDFVYSRKVLTKLIINDGVYNLEYPLADLLVIPKVAAIKDPGYNIVADISEDVPFLVKAQNALDTNCVYFSPTRKISGEQIIEVNFGENNSHSNRISYNICNIEEVKNVPTSCSLLFDSTLLKEILKCNGNATSSKMYIFTDGLMRLEFEEGDITSTYFLVKKDDI
jgi:hypothetical protein